MAEVTVRDAHRGDAWAISDVTTSAVPYEVCSPARVAADMRQDAIVGRRRWVGLLRGQLVGTATARQTGERHGAGDVFVTVKVHPGHGSQGVGTALLAVAIGCFPAAEHLRSVCSGTGISLAFSVRNDFLPEFEHEVARVDPRTVSAVATEPSGLRAVTLEALPDLRMLLETHNLSADDDPAGRTRRLTMYQLRTAWWSQPDNAPDLSWGLVAGDRERPVLAAFTSVLVDPEHGRSWSRTTATHPTYRGTGLARWVKQRSLNALGAAGVEEAWTQNDEVNAPMLAVNSALGYRPAARMIRLLRPGRAGAVS